MKCTVVTEAIRLKPEVKERVLFKKTADQDELQIVDTLISEDLFINQIGSSEELAVVSDIHGNFFSVMDACLLDDYEELVENGSFDETLAFSFSDFEVVKFQRVLEL